MVWTSLQLNKKVVQLRNSWHQNKCPCSNIRRSSSNKSKLTTISLRPTNGRSVRNKSRTRPTGGCRWRRKVLEIISTRSKEEAQNLKPSGLLKRLLEQLLSARRKTSISRKLKWFLICRRTIGSSRTKPRETLTWRSADRSAKPTCEA